MRTRSRLCSRRTVRRSTRNATLLAALSLAVAPAAAAATQSFKWEDLQKQGRIAAGRVVPAEAGSPERSLEVRNANPTPLTASVLTIETPPIGGSRYRITGRVRYDNVEGVGYLEMWNYFPGGGQYFTRTLAEQGPMMKVQGSSGWRPFVLPFDATGAPHPTRLVVNVVLPGKGTVYLGSLELSDDPGAAAVEQTDTSRLAGLAGGVAGAVIGSLGALIGVLVSLGRARRFVIASARSLIAFGTLAFLAGIVAFASARSYSSVYPTLLLLGFLSSVIPLSLLPTIRRRYEEIELRMMRARDV
jgi:hypothetical protein